MVTHAMVTRPMAKKLCMNVESTFFESSLTLNFLIGFTDGLECPSASPSGATAPSGADTVVAGSLGTQQRDDVRVTIDEVRWGIGGDNQFSQPATGMTWVGVLVTYEAIVGEVFVSTARWVASDRDGWAYRATYALADVEPDLRMQDLRAGSRTRGWVLFEVPEDTDWLELVEEGNTLLNDAPLTWEAER